MNIFDYCQPEPNSGCWLWLRHIAGGNPYGYLQHERRKWSAHRFSYHLHCGPIPEGMHVLHRCDLPACVNPDHLFLGTRSDNMRDMRAKGRQGSRDRYFRARNPNARLSEQDVAEIRALLSVEPGRKRRRRGLVAALAAKYGVTTASIHNVLRGKTWQLPHHGIDVRVVKGASA